MKIRVPASSANLGPGFDSFGIAWQLYNEIEFTAEEQGVTVTNCEERFRGENNLAVMAYRRALETCGIALKGLHVDFTRTEIPVSRGLGSSAALITAGVMAANELEKLGLDCAALLDIATSVEGHPDNIAPALFGGLTVSLMEGTRAITRVFPLSDKLCFTLLIPPFELSTALSRSVMPREVHMSDAVYNLSRAALLPRALGDGDTELLHIALSDRLHQPYRFGLIEGNEKARDLANTLGASGCCISGAGSTLLCISDDPGFVLRMTEAMKLALPDWRVVRSEPDRDGASII